MPVGKRRRLAGRGSRRCRFGPVEMMDAYRRLDSVMPNPPNVQDSGADKPLGFV
jgi:hypothetical protein